MLTINCNNNNDNNNNNNKIQQWLKKKALRLECILGCWNYCQKKQKTLGKQQQQQQQK